uniref:Reverse transcriptase domain-containing protein n=1 Tax=Heracleum sosnowskyi TaxID=360622 RepID=A0AAD8H7G0_9APIA|nr:hypothetical protein POM88_045538 [Heracleum sosnowskyi]
MKGWGKKLIDCRKRLNDLSKSNDPALWNAIKEEEKSLSYLTAKEKKNEIKVLQDEDDVFQEDELMVEHIIIRFSEDDIVNASRDMNPTETPGRDGLSAGFYKTHWNIVKNDIIRVFLNVLNHNVSLESSNDTLIVLFPKTESPEKMSLYNTIYKVISKCIANRLKDSLKEESLGR